MNRNRMDLYLVDGCPYCNLVRRYIDATDLEREIDVYDIDEDPHAYQRLHALTGDDQVPCLVVGGRPMLESEEIVRWLSERFQGGEARASA